MTKTAKPAKPAPKRKPRAKARPRPAAKAETLPAVIPNPTEPTVLSPYEQDRLNRLDRFNEDTGEIKPSKHAPKDTDPAKVRELVTVKGLPYSQAGKVLGVTKQAIHYLCMSHGIPRKAQLEQYKHQRADIIAAKQMQVLSGLDDASLQKCSAYQRVGMFGILYDKERLERGQSTQNVGQQIEYLSDKTADKLDRLLNDDSGN